MPSFSILERRGGGRRRPKGVGGRDDETTRNRVKEAIERNAHNKEGVSG